MLCYCGHDCSRCKTYVATMTNDDALRREAAAYCRETFGRDIPPEEEVRQ